MRRFTVRRDVFLPHLHGMSPFPGFATYADRDGRRQFMLYAWELASDNRDYWTELHSDDNGATWTRPRQIMLPEPRDGGRFKVSEVAGFFDATANRIVTLGSQLLYPDDGDCDPHQPVNLRIQEYDVAAGAWGEASHGDFGFPRGVMVSFTFPLRLASGRILFPAMTPSVDAEGKVRRHPAHSWSPPHAIVSLLAERDAAGALRWTAGQPLDATDAQSTRGFSENTVAQLADGRLAAVLRASNAGAEDTIPGCKYVAFSDDEGIHWNAAAPWRYDTGDPVASSATGSCLFRDARDGRLYWVGNISADGETVRGNWPRSPLVLGLVNEESFTLVRASVRVIDRRAPWESEGCQLSNFRCHQDRETGELVLYMTRFGEYDATDWNRANFYRYRIDFSA